jgi:cation transport ATPase
VDPLALAAALESKSSHPLASAIVSAYCGCVAEFAGKLHEVKKIAVTAALSSAFSSFSLNLR